MKAKVITPFFDLTTGLGNVPENTYWVGDEYEGSAARINDLAKRGFVEKIPRTRKSTPKDK